MRDKREIIHIVLVTFVSVVLTVSGRADRNDFSAGHISSFTDGQAERKTKMAIPQNKQAQKKDDTPVGTWGGEHVSLEITERGGSVEFDCAQGTIDQRVSLDRQGNFDVPGTYVEEHGGPVRKDEQGRSYPVRYTGRIKDGKMSLTVRRSGSRKVIGTFTLVLGQEAMLFKCR